MRQGQAVFSWVRFGIIGMAAFGCGSSGTASNADASAAGGGANIGGSATGVGGATSTAGGAARGGSVGSAGAGVGTSGAAGSTVPTVDGVQCSPGQSMLVGQGSNWVACYPPTYLYPYQLGIPGGGEISLYSVTLPSAMVPGSANAISMPVSGSAPFDFELWGTSSICGQAGELLWWSSFATGTHCAEFVPSQAYTHVLVVNRQMKDVSSYFFSTPSMNLCPGGTCQGKATGNGKQSGVALTAPAGHYPLYRMDSLSRGWDFGVGVRGRVTVALNGSRSTLDTPVAIAAGIFRMQEPDPFSDAWYCIGDGSTVARHEDKNGSTNSFDFSLRNITRLAVCSEHTGAGTLSWQIANFKTDITSTLPAWVAAQVTADEQDCFGVDCRYRFYTTPQIQFAYLNLGTTPGSYYSPTRQTVSVLEAALFTQPTALAPYELNCATSGSFYYDPAATSTLALSNIGETIACPGAVIANASFDFSGDQY